MASIRAALLAGLRRRRFERQLRRSSGPLRLVVGASGTRTPPGWISSEEDFVDLLRPDTWLRYFAEESVATIVAEHVWEHLDEEQGLAAARTCIRFLEPGGRLRLAVPDGNSPDPAYIDAVMPGGTGAGADDHKMLYTAESLTELCASAGFEVDVLEHFDAEGRFHRRPWDPDEGMIRRSLEFDPRNRDGLVYTSLIIDALKPPAPFDGR
jgi:predicted SAM-dependent methyltransferase